MTDADLNEADPSSDSGHVQPLDSGKLTASQMLVGAREAKGLSQREVADQLYLSIRFIGLIDDGDYHKLAKPAFVKGYLRSYARLVSLDGDAVVSAYDRDWHGTMEVDAVCRVTKEAVGSRALTGPVVQTGLIGVGLLLIVIAAVWWLAAAGFNAAPPEVTASGAAERLQAPSVQEPAHTVPDTLVEPASHAVLDEVAAVPLTPQAVPQVMPAGTDTVSTRDDAAVVIERKHNGDKENITVLAGGNDQMGFAFGDKCWVEITDGHGQKIYSALNQAGDVMTVDGMGPFDVLLGKASAVTMTWHGQPVDVLHYIAKNETAKIKTARL